MERNLKQTGLVNLVVLLAIGIASTVLARYSGSLAAQAGSTVSSSPIAVTPVSRA